QLEGCAGVGDVSELYLAYKLKDLLTVQAAMLTACIDYSETAGATRGSALYRDKGGLLREGLDELFRFTPETKYSGDKVQQIRKEGGSFKTAWRPVRPIPKEDAFFENVWRSYQKNKNVY
ncbi:MAG: oxidoreductase, partial [Abditibacteriota bacterium]|nr:oxidoreductase [Abditibacteriota bacterium]